MASSHDASLSTHMHSAQASWQDPNVAARYVNAENATRTFAKLLVAKAKLSEITDDVHIFDLATGTGAAVQEIYDAVPQEKWGKVKVLGGDLSEPMLGYLRDRGVKEGWSGLECKVMDGNDITSPPNTFTHVICTFAIFVIPNCLPSLFSILKPGGFVGVSTWASLPWMPLVTSSIALMPSAPYNPSELEVANKIYSDRAWGSPQYLTSQLEAAGFTNVHTEVKKDRASVGSKQMFMETMQFPLMLVKAFWPEEDRERLGKELNTAMEGEVDKYTGGNGNVEMEFEGVCAWGWKE